jgi:hypothetical protein
MHFNVKSLKHHNIDLRVELINISIESEIEINHLSEVTQKIWQLMIRRICDLFHLQSLVRIVDQGRSS